MDSKLTNGTHEQTLNVALGEVLDGLRRSWSVRSERTGNILVGGGRPDILVEEASGWPVVIEAERSNHAEAEDDAKKRLGRTVAQTGRQIETAIALVYPSNLHSLDGSALRKALTLSQELEYALYTRSEDDLPDRLPIDGWIMGGVRDLAILVRRAAVPPPRINALAAELEDGVRIAGEQFTRRHKVGSELGRKIAKVLGQEDDRERQTRRMAMTVIANALIFHESLAEAEFKVEETEGGPERAVQPVAHFRPGGLFAHADLCLEWERILRVNYWPIFWSAKEMLGIMPSHTAHSILEWLWNTGQKLVAGGVTQSHDLTGIVFQRLIADRKFLATYYTRPEAAALLAALALPVDSPPGGAKWGDAETLAGAQIGDFTCGTGTLLSMAYQRMSLLHELHGGDPSKLHGPMMKHGLVGLDVLNIGVHLTAAMLAGSHPDTPFDGECLLTMPYGKQDSGDVAIGSLELMAQTVYRSFMDTATAVSAGGRAPEEVVDLVSRVGHGKFDLVIMNPPFVRSTGIEGDKLATGNPAFAGLKNDKRTQKKMQKRLVSLRGSAPLGTGNAGLAADFLDVALRKARRGGNIALVLPLSAISGVEWERTRKTIIEKCRNVVIVTIAGARSDESSFSADTDMADCLLIARKGGEEDEKRATFIVLHRSLQSAVEAELIAAEVARIRESGQMATMEHIEGESGLLIGKQQYGVIIDAPLPNSGAWPLVGIRDADVAHAAWSLERGDLVQLGLPGRSALKLPIVPISQIGGRGPYHADIYWSQPDGTPRGPFDLIKPAVSPVPTYPMLWAHEANLERRLVVKPDSEGRLKAPSGKILQSDIKKKARDIRATATRSHYNRDVRFNSQSLIVAMTERQCIGGRAWPSVIFDDQKHEYAFALWCNSTLGLLLHWWVTNKTQSGRGNATVTSIPNIPTLDVKTLSEDQLATAREVFNALKDWRFLPFDQIDEDPARAELDRRLLVDVLGLPESLVDDGGPIDLLRRKLAQEPQIHGGKKSRVVFDEDGERSERRTDR